jgi:hypothetical protein
MILKIVRVELKTGAVVLLKYSVVKEKGIAICKLNLFKLNNFSFLSLKYIIQLSRDNECQPGLICGKDNCKQYHPKAEKSSDCCMKPPSSDSKKL